MFICLENKGKHLLFFFTILVFSCDFIDFRTAFFSVSVDERFDNNSHFFSHLPPPLKNPNHYTFLVISDTHYANENFNYFEAIERMRKKYQIEFVILNGDITQSGLKKQFQLALQDKNKLQIPVYPVIGNHDIYHNGTKMFGKYFGQYIYAFKIDKGNTAFLFLDTANGILGEKQKSWYQKQLEKYQSENIFVFTHYNINERKVQDIISLPYPEERYFLIDLHEKHHVDYFISGHLHSNNQSKIRGTTYITVKNAAQLKEAGLLIKVNGKQITTHFIDIEKDL